MVQQPDKRGSRPAKKKEESVTIEKLMSVAIGQIGMDYGTFLSLTPDEFNAIYDAWREKEEVRARDEWNRMRLLAAITVSPHCKNKIHPDKLLPLPWDKKKTPAEKAEVRILSKEERRERIRELKKAMAKA